MRAGVLQLDSPWGAKYVARAFPCDVCKAAIAGFTTMSDDKDRASLEELESKLAAVTGKREELHSPNRATGQTIPGDGAWHEDFGGNDRRCSCWLADRLGAGSGA